MNGLALYWPFKVVGQRSVNWVSLEDILQNGSSTRPGNFRNSSEVGLDGRRAAFDWLRKNHRSMAVAGESLRLSVFANGVVIGARLPSAPKLGSVGPCAIQQNVGPSRFR